jgi:hypothetical protein
MPVIPKPGTRKQKYFNDSNVFMLSGHGSEHLGERYALGSNEYGAIPVSAGQITATTNEILYSKFYARIGNKIAIPDGGESATRKSFGFGSAVKQVSLGKDDGALPLEQFKLYKPRSDSRQRNDFYKTSIPNLSFYPVSCFQSKFDFDGQNEQFYYNEIIYNTNDIECIDLTLSGILRRNNRVKFTSNETSEEPLYMSDDSAMVMITVKKGFRQRTLGDIYKMKNKDPMTYDFVQLIKASFKGSLLTFNDVCLICLIAQEKLPKFKFDDLAVGGFGENFIRARQQFDEERIEQLSMSLHIYDILYESYMSLQTVYYLLNNLWNVQGSYMVLSPICRELRSDHGSENIKFMREKSR